MSIANVYHDKICRPWHEGNFHFGKLFVEVSATFIDHALCITEMLVVLKRCKCADLGNAVHVKWLPCFVEHLNQISRRSGVTDSQAGQSMNLRKRAQDNNVPSFANELQRIRRIIKKFEIGFIENNDDIFRDARHEVVDLAL